MSDFYIWPVTRRMTRLLASIGFHVCPTCGRVTTAPIWLALHLRAHTALPRESA